MKIKFQILEAGFSLIELLVVMAVFMVVSSLIVNVILIHVKTVDKTNAETAIRQSGNGVISQIAKDIRAAGSVACSGSGDSLTIVPKLEPTTTITYECDTTNKKIKKTIGASTVDLTDRSKIALSVCTFTCVNKPIITVSFTLEEADRTIGDKVVIPFQTSVKIRNK